jgi:hypothetical protein
MKRYTLSAGLLALALALGLCPFTPSLSAQSQSQYPGAQRHQAYPTGQQQPNSGAQQQPEQQQSQIFMGEIEKLQGGQYALITNKSSNAGHYLDDQSKAKEFVGKKVKVTGTLDVATNTIHVTDIEPA